MIGVSTYNIGNFVNVTNVYGQPDIGEISGETTPYKEIEEIIYRFWINRMVT